MNKFFSVLMPTIMICFLFGVSFAGEYKPNWPWKGKLLPQDREGTLNPEELSLAGVIQRAKDGQVDMMICAQGYYFIKAGDHQDSEFIFKRCAEAGYTGAMIWLSYLYKNGTGTPEELEKSLYWEKKAADSGNELGMYNYGISLITGNGAPKDEVKGLEYIQKAAESGLKEAKQYLEEINQT